MRTTIRHRMEHLAAAAVTVLAAGAAVALVASIVVAPAHVDEAHAAGMPGMAMMGSSARAAAAPQPEIVSALAPASAPQSLFIPPLLGSRLEGSTRVFHLTAQAGTITRFGERLATAGFNGGYLAPTIRVRRGEHVRVDIDNALAEPTTVHWHGLHVAAADDGGPYGLIAAGGSRHPEFDVTQQATTLWYHPHVMGRTAPQVGRGMAGLLEIDDPASAAQRALPHRYGVDDIPLVLQGAPLPVSGAAPTARRPLFVNGTPNAVLRRTAGRVRLRMVNATAGAILGVSIVGAVRVRQVGSDGGLLPSAVATRSVVLGPSERAELVVDLRRGSRVAVQSSVLTDTGAGAGAAQAAYLRGVRRPADTGTLLTLVNTARSLPVARALPVRLNAAPALDLSHAVQREMVLGPTIQINGQLMQDTDGGASMAGTLRIPLDQTEVWTITNTSQLTHVFHVHDIEFEVLDRDGSAPPASERGWKDSVHVPPGGELRIAMQFTDFADPDDPYMFHCHVLRHEDAGMMGQFVVVPAAA